MIAGQADLEIEHETRFSKKIQMQRMAFNDARFSPSLSGSHLIVSLNTIWTHRKHHYSPIEDVETRIRTLEITGDK